MKEDLERRRKHFRSLLPLVNEKEQMDRLAAHVAYRIEALHHGLEQTSDILQIRLLQGQIRELRRLLTLRDETLREAE